MLEAVVLSDVHLDGLNKHFVDANDRIFAEMDKVYQYAITNGIKHVFFPGDLADTPDLDWDTYIKLYLFLKKYDGLLHTYYIAGNHDFADIENTSMNFLNVLARNKGFKTFHIYLKPERVIIDDVPVNFLPYPCLTTLTKKEGAVNFAHVEYSGAIGDNGRALTAKHELQSHPDDFTVSGHIHQYQYLAKKRAVYCGNPFQKNFGESLPKGFIHFTATTKKGKIEFKHKFIENKPNFTLQNLHIDDINDFNKLVHDDSIRYKLHLAPDILVPADLLLTYPNITGGIWISGKKTVEVDGEERAVLNSSINLRTGLRQYLVADGFDKKQLKLASKAVKEACDFLGVS